MSPAFQSDALPVQGDVPDATGDVGVAALHHELAATSWQPEQRDPRRGSGRRS